MDTGIISLQRIELEARQAAARYSDINAACPYPWGSDAAIAFKREFLAQRLLIEMDEADTTDSSTDEPFCTCEAIHGIEELDWNKCDSCGKPINP